MVPSFSIRHFLKWFNGIQAIAPVLAAGLAHLWLVTIHPFEDGNGRVVRAIADMAPARFGKEHAAVLQHVGVFRSGIPRM